MLDLLHGLSLAKLLPALLILNVLLSGIASVLQILQKKEIPWLSSIASGLKKLIDFVSANNAH